MLLTTQLEVNVDVSKSGCGASSNILTGGGCWPRGAQAAKPMPLTPRLDDPVGTESSTTSPQLTTALAADPEDQAAQQPDDPDPVPGYKISGQLAFDSIHALSILLAAAISCSPHLGTCRQS
jgi:hypothetical protein